MRKRYPTALIVNDSFTTVATLPRPGVYYHGLITIVLTFVGTPLEITGAGDSGVGNPFDLQHKK